MPAPSTSWSTVPVYATYRKLDSSPVPGTIKFTVSDRVVSNTDDIIFPEGSTFSVDLSGTGSFSIDLPAVDDPDNSPENWSIKVEEKLTGITGRTYYIQPVLAHLDLVPPGLDLRTIVLDSTNSSPTVAEQAGVPGGLAKLDSSGLVINADGSHPAGGGGGGTVNTVNAIPPVDGNITLAKGDIGLGNVDNTHDNVKAVASAAKWTTGRQIALVGDVTGAVTVDGTVDVSIDTTLGGGTVGTQIINANTQGDAWTALGSVPTANLPALAINDTFTVANQTARLALTAQRGDMAFQSDTSTWYILAADAPATDANWKAISVPALVSSVAGHTGVVTLTAADVGISASTTSAAGIVELATTAEATTGTDTVRAVTPAGVSAVVSAKVFDLTALPYGSEFRITYDGTNWKYLGATITTRPSARTPPDLTMICQNSIDTTVPSFALTGDVLELIS